MFLSLKEEDIFSSKVNTALFSVADKYSLGLKKHWQSVGWTAIRMAELGHNFKIQRETLFQELKAAFPSVPDPAVRQVMKQVGWEILDFLENCLEWFQFIKLNYKPVQISQNGRFLYRKLFIIPCLDSPCWQSHHVNQLKRPDWSGDVFSIFFCPQKRKRKFIKTSKQILTRSEAASKNPNHKDILQHLVLLNILSFSKVKLDKQGNNSLALFDVKWYFFVFKFLLCFLYKKKHWNLNTFSIDYFYRI